MSDTKISELPEVTGVGANDYLIVVSNPGANAETSKIQAGNFFGNVTVVTRFGANVAVVNTALIQANNVRLNSLHTPSSSSANCVKGDVFFDTNYVYVATANNTLKRAALSSF